VIQRNALKSWTLAARDAEVILFGDEEGASEAAREIGIAHVANVERSVLSSGYVSTNLETQGPKILRSFFDEAQRMAQYETVCYVNCDIILMEDFAAATAKLRAATSEYLMVAGDGTPMSRSRSLLKNRAGKKKYGKERGRRINGDRATGSTTLRSEKDFTWGKCRRW
jgi:hypothetical protein